MNDLVQYVAWNQIENLMKESTSVSRRRIMYTLHQPEDVVQRMINVLQAGSYIRPHKHENPDKVETFVVLRGEVAFFWFEADGGIRSAKIISSSSDIFMADVLAGTWHTYIPTVDNTVVFESKEGPYDPATDKKFAQWAPSEGSAEVDAYVKELLLAAN